MDPLSPDSVDQAVDIKYWRRLFPNNQISEPLTPSELSQDSCLSADDIDRFRRDGAVVISQAIDEAHWH